MIWIHWNEIENKIKIKTKWFMNEHNDFHRWFFCFENIIRWWWWWWLLWSFEFDPFRHFYSNFIFPLLQYITQNQSWIKFYTKTKIETIKKKRKIHCIDFVYSLLTINIIIVFHFIYFAKLIIIIIIITVFILYYYPFDRIDLCIWFLNEWMNEKKFRSHIKTIIVSEVCF